jgi:hypothetical protein
MLKTVNKIFAQMNARKAKAAEIKKAKEDEAARILAVMGREKEDEMRRKEEMEELINRLYYEEGEKKHREREASKREKDARMMQEMKQVGQSARRSLILTLTSLEIIMRLRSLDSKPWKRCIYCV